ncbi:uncharacterized protein V1516DRAFT_618598 [Lipomyces oligophaga]|uniref:uncharacterized protein n=1 Tax=Lipomyces oligophaga TaxID=45792 RepID=UPI0034CD727B
MAPPRAGVLVKNELARPRPAPAGAADRADSDDSDNTASNTLRGRRSRTADSYAAVRSQLSALSSNPERAGNIIDALRPPAPESLISAPPDIVTNVQGSSAGAGSGEFHVYKQARRREMERLKIFDDQRKNEQDKLEFDQKRRSVQEADRLKTEKNRAKRRKRNRAVKNTSSSSASSAANPTTTTAATTAEVDPTSTSSTSITSSATAPAQDGEISLTIIDDDF